MRLFVVLFFLAACTEPAKDTAEDSADAPLAPPPAGEGFQVSMTSSAPAYEEVWKCAIYDIPITEYTPISWIEYQQTDGMHHMTLSTPGLFATTGLEHGVYDCEDIYQGESLMADQIQFFGSTGASSDTMHLPDGVVANMPPNIEIIHEIHYVNPTAEEVSLTSTLNAWAAEDADGAEGIWGSQVRDQHIEVPARSTHTEWTRCVMNTDVEVHFLASHMHQLGVEFTIAPFDGATTGDIIYSNDDWHDAKIVQYDPPLVIPAGEGFEYACTFDNNTDEAVAYGLESTDEMCNLALVHTPFDMDALCEVVETSDGVLWSPR